MPPGNKCINTALGSVQLVRPQGDKGQCLLRAWPAPGLEDPANSVQPCRNSQAPGDITEFMVKVMAAAFIGLGEDKRTFLCYLSGDQAGAEESPYRRFTKTCFQAKKVGKFHGSDNMEWKGTWNKYMEGNKGKGGPAIPDITGIWHLQGHVYINGDQKYMTADRGFVPLGMGDNDPLPVIQITDNVGGKLKNELLDTPKDTWEGDDPMAPYKYDPIGVFDPDTRTMKGGMFIGIFKPNVYKLPVPPGSTDPKNPGKPHPQLTPTTWDGQPPKTKAGIWGYDAYLRRQYIAEKGQPTLTADMDAAQTATMLKKYRFWLPDPDDKTSQGLLHIMSAEEQMREIAEAYAAEPKLVRFALGDQSELFTDEIEAILNNKKTFVNPGVAKVHDEPDPDLQPEGEPEAPPAARTKTAKDVVAPPGDIHDYASEFGGDPSAPAEEEPDAESTAEVEAPPVDETPAEEVPVEAEAGVEGAPEGEPEAVAEGESNAELEPEAGAEVDPDGDPDGGAAPPAPPQPKPVKKQPPLVKVIPPVGKASDKTLFDGDPDAPEPIEEAELEPEVAEAAEVAATMQASLKKGANINKQSAPPAATPATNAAAGRAVQRKGPAAPPAPPAGKPATTVAKPTNRPAPVSAAKPAAPAAKPAAPAAKPAQAGKKK